MHSKHHFGRITCLVLAALALGACERKTAEEKGHDAAAEKAGYVKGVGEALKKEGEDAAMSLGQGVGKVVKSAVGGVSGGFSTYPTEASANAKAKQLQITRAERRSAKETLSPTPSEADKSGEGKADAAAPKDQGRVITAYLIANQAYTGKVRLLALNGSNQELGRASADLKLANGDAGYTDFTFDQRTPLNEVAKVVLDVQ